MGFGFSLKDATTEFCGPVAAVVAVASSPELFVESFWGLILVVATVDLQNSVAAAVSAAATSPHSLNSAKVIKFPPSAV